MFRASLTLLLLLFSILLVKMSFVNGDRSGSILQLNTDHSSFCHLYASHKHASGCGQFLARLKDGRMTLEKTPSLPMIHATTVNELKIKLESSPGRVVLALTLDQLLNKPAIVRTLLRHEALIGGIVLFNEKAILEDRQLPELSSKSSHLINLTSTRNDGSIQHQLSIAVLVKKDLDEAGKCFQGTSDSGPNKVLTISQIQLFRICVKSKQTSGLFVSREIEQLLIGYWPFPIVLFDPDSSTKLSRDRKSIIKNQFRNCIGGKSKMDHTCLVKIRASYVTDHLSQQQPVCPILTPKQTPSMRHLTENNQLFCSPLSGLLSILRVTEPPHPGGPVVLVLVQIDSRGIVDPSNMLLSNAPVSLSIVMTAIEGLIRSSNLAVDDSKLTLTHGLVVTLIDLEAFDQSGSHRLLRAFLDGHVEGRIGSGEEECRRDFTDPLVDANTRRQLSTNCTTIWLDQVTEIVEVNFVHPIRTRYLHQRLFLIDQPSENTSSSRQSLPLEMATRLGLGNQFINNLPPSNLNKNHLPDWLNKWLESNKARHLSNDLARARPSHVLTGQWRLIPELMGKPTSYLFTNLADEDEIQALSQLNALVNSTNGGQSSTSPAERLEFLQRSAMQLMELLRLLTGLPSSKPGSNVADSRDGLADSSSMEDDLEFIKQNSMSHLALDVEKYLDCSMDLTKCHFLAENGISIQNESINLPLASTRPKIQPGLPPSNSRKSLWQQLSGLALLFSLNLMGCVLGPAKTGSHHHPTRWILPQRVAMVGECPYAGNNNISTKSVQCKPIGLDADWRLKDKHLKSHYDTINGVQEQMFVIYLHGRFMCVLAPIYIFTSFEPPRESEFNDSNLTELSRAHIRNRVIEETNWPFWVIFFTDSLGFQFSLEFDHQTVSSELVFTVAITILTCALACFAFGYKCCRIFELFGRANEEISYPSNRTFRVADSTIRTFVLPTLHQHLQFEIEKFRQYHGKMIRYSNFDWPNRIESNDQNPMLSELSSFGQVVVESLQPNITELLTIWDYIGLSETERQASLEGVLDQLQSVMSQLIASQNERRLDLESRIESTRRQVSETSLQLRLAPYVPDHQLSCMEMLKSLEEKRAELSALKTERFSSYSRLRSGIVKWSRLLNEPPESVDKRLAKFPDISTSSISADETAVSPSTSHIPEQKELDQLGDIHNQLESRYAPLLATFTSLCDDVKRIAEEIDYAPEGVKEIDLFTHRLGLERLGKLGLAKLTPGRVRKVTLLVSPDSNDNSVLNQQQQPDSTSDSGTGGDTNEPIIDDDVIKCLSDLRLKLIKQKARLAATGDELRDYLKRMWTRLGRSPEEQVKGVDLMSSGGFKPSVIEALQEEVDKCQQQKWENVDQYLTNLLTEVSELAGKCCITYNSTEYETLSSKIGQNDRETTVNNLETKADQLADAYLNHKAIYDSLATYRDACTNLNQIDARLRDPAILSNRGGILLKTEKERKVRFKELQRLEAETVDSVKQYQNKTNQTFQLIDGTLVEEFIKSLNYDLKVSRDNSRVRKPSRPLSGNTTVAQQSNGTPS